MSSIVVVGDVYALVARRDEVSELMRETQDRARTEPGCVGFSFAEVVGDPGHYVVVEEWSDDEALASHFSSDTFTDYQRRVTDLLATSSDVRIHHVSDTIDPVDSAPMDPRRAD